MFPQLSPDCHFAGFKWELWTLVVIESFGTIHEKGPLTINNKENDHGALSGRTAGTPGI
jgi:hypothetical protein